MEKLRLNQELTTSFKLCDEPQIPFELAEEVLEAMGLVFVSEYDIVQSAPSLDYKWMGYCYLGGKPPEGDFSKYE